jgi:hypothetical protein
MIIFEQDLEDEVTDYIVFVRKTSTTAFHVPDAVRDLALQSRVQSVYYAAITGQKCAY